MTRLSAAVGALIVLVAAPSSAQDAQEELALILAGLAGKWVGEAVVYDVDTGDSFRVGQSFAVALVGEEGLDFARWDADRLAIAIHQGGGAYNRRGWEDGALSEEYASTLAVAGHDGAGSGMLVETYSAVDETGAVIEMREEWALEGDALTGRVFVSGEAAGAEPTLFYEGAFARAR